MKNPSSSRTKAHSPRYHLGLLISDQHTLCPDYHQGSALSGGPVPFYAIMVSSAGLAGDVRRRPTPGLLPANGNPLSSGVAEAYSSRLRPNYLIVSKLYTLPGPCQFRWIGPCQGSGKISKACLAALLISEFLSNWTLRSADWASAVCHSTKRSNATMRERVLAIS